MENPNSTTDSEVIGILRWEKGCVPRGLLQLEKLKGNSTNPDSFQFPVKYTYVKGANVHTILEEPCYDVLKTMIREAQKMENDGIRAITTSCGFNAIFQREIAESVNIPVFTSSLMQIPLVQNMIGKQKKVGVITARRSALSKKHLQNAGIEHFNSIVIEGLDETEWRKIHSKPEDDLNIAKLEDEIYKMANSMMIEFDIGAFILECTDLPPFAAGIRKTTGRPVFDFVTLTNYAYQAVYGAL